MGHTETYFGGAGVERSVNRPAVFRAGRAVSEIGVGVGAGGQQSAPNPSL